MMSSMKSLSLVLVSLVGFSNSLYPCSPDLPGGGKCEEGKFSVYPDPDSCSDFWQCINGCAQKVSCDDGFLFDEDLQMCEDEDKVDCGCGHEISWQGHPDGLYADPYNCRQYWNVEDGVGIEQTCDEDYVFDEQNKWCDFPDRVDCKDRLICDDCDKHCHASVPSTSTTEDPDIFCTPFCKGDGDFAMGCCLDRFCKCWQGVGKVILCQPTLQFDEDVDQCVWPYDCTCH
ncbi:probable chitinase 10 [Eurytemora carolleeae]|uniref:probable chitinase 10 n=1 Tax=Eurytemora carolleeae TaxID=1294199 RepID=UPI000C7609B4|nr:probable chitinase 10 [Eurytemora carolleeae]|eukprot:XP_023327994.1 probable chitinase 10 [Eurytemora affinis]